MTSECEAIAAEYALVHTPGVGGGRVLNKALYGEAPLGGSNPYPLIY